MRFDLGKIEQTSSREEIVATYGLAGAELIMGTMLDALRNANEVLPCLQPIDDIQVAVADMPASYNGHDAWFRPSTGKMYFAFDKNAKPEDIAEDLPYTIAHEAAHQIHHQHMMAAGLEKSRSWFKRAVDEGTAEVGASFQQVALYDPGNALPISPDMHERHMAVLDVVLYDKRWPSQEGYYQFMQVLNENQWPKGYAAAKYLVEVLMSHHNYSLKKVMRTPEEEFREFVEVIR